MSAIEDYKSLIKEMKELGCRYKLTNFELWRIYFDVPKNFSEIGKDYFSAFGKLGLKLVIKEKLRR